MNELNDASEYMAMPDEQKVRSGPDKRITDKDLSDFRDKLYNLFDRTWCAVALPLTEFRREDQVFEAFRVWAGWDFVPSIKSLFTAHVDFPTLGQASKTIHSENDRSARRIEELSREIGQLDSARLRLSEQVQSTRRECEHLEQIPQTDVSTEELRIIAEHRAEVCSLGIKDQEALNTANRRIPDARIELQNLKGIFARRQFLQFCGESRYELNPRNLANSLAGVPAIGWRHSINRCRKWDLPVGDQGYRTYKMIERMVADCEGSNISVDQARTWLQKARVCNGTALKALKTLKAAFYDLMYAIEHLDTSKIKSRMIAGVIAQAYYQSTQKQSSLLLILRKKYAL